MADDSTQSVQNGTTPETTENGKNRKRGPNKIYFSLAGIKLVPKRDDDGKIVKEDGKQVKEYVSLQERIEVPHAIDVKAAYAAFKEKHGVAASSHDGPFYVVKSGAAMERRIHVNVPIENMALSGHQWNAVFQGWKVIAMGLKAFDKDADGTMRNFKEDDVVLVVVGDPVSADGKTPKPKFGGTNKTIVRTALENQSRL